MRQPLASESSAVLLAPRLLVRGPSPRRLLELVYLTADRSRTAIGRSAHLAFNRLNVRPPACSTPPRPGAGARMATPRDGQRRGAARSPELLGALLPRLRLL